MNQRTTATVELIRDKETTWLNVKSETKEVCLNLACDTRGKLSMETLKQWADSQFNKPGVTTATDDLEAELYDLTVQLWYRLMPESAKNGRHPGPSGPAGNEHSWTPRRGYLEGAITQLKQVLVNTPLRST